MFGSNKALIAQYEARISELKAQIQDLRLMVLPAAHSRHIPMAALEADAILSNKEETIELSDEEINERQMEISERDRILSGNF